MPSRILTIDGSRTVARAEGSANVMGVTMEMTVAGGRDDGRNQQEGAGDKRRKIVFMDAETACSICYEY